MFIIDFDDTLFDTHTFKQMLPDLKCHAELVSASRSRNKFGMTIEERVKNLLFADAVPFLEFLKEKDQSLVLLTLGEANFQKIKIDITGIAKFFDSIHITENAKELAVDKIFHEFKNEESAWLINDKIEETKKIIQHHPKLKPILKMSPKFPEEEYKLSLMPYFSTLTEIQQYVQQHFK